MRTVVFAGVGNTLAGDDGVGIFMVRKLKEALHDHERFRFVELEGDLYEIWDMLPTTEAFVFLDAVTGDYPGQLKQGKTLPRAYTPSFHQSDLSAVVLSLQKLWDGPFPKWTLRGVAIDPPEVLGEGLSPAVAVAVDKAVADILSELNGSGLDIDGLTVKL